MGNHYAVQHVVGTTSMSVKWRIIDVFKPFLPYVHGAPWLSGISYEFVHPSSGLKPSRVTSCFSLKNMQLFLHVIKTNIKITKSTVNWSYINKGIL